MFNDYLLERRIFDVGTILTGRIQRTLKLKISVDKELVRNEEGLMTSLFDRMAKFLC
jgi:hypothetical protein